MNTPLLNFVLPYYNEADFIGATLASLTRQTDRRFSLILVDNASTDGSEEIARCICANEMPDIPVTFLKEHRPGKLFALATGIEEANALFVATIDADTIYPQDFVAEVIALFERDDTTVAVLAHALKNRDSKIASAKQQVFAKLFPRKCHTGGHGQIFKRVKLEQAGGFDPQLWPYVLEDHEVIHRIGKLGKLAYRKRLVCHPSDRRSDRTDCSWSLCERILYKLTPQPMMDWLFYKFLARRFERRGLRNIKLRQKSWNDGTA